MFRQQQHVVPALAQRWDGHRHRRNAKVQVFAKHFLRRHLLQVAVCRHHDPNVYLNRLRPAHPFESSFFQHAQQFRLNRQRQFPNLIQKQRPAMRQIHLADLARARARERPSLVPEQLIFHKPFRNRRAIQRHKRFLAPRRKMMDRQRK